jgi:hypothetical protein
LLELLGGGHDAGIRGRCVNRSDGQPHGNDSDNVSSSYHATSKTTVTSKMLAVPERLNKIKDYASPFRSHTNRSRPMGTTSYA